MDQLTLLYEENRSRYATADATISLQSIPLFLCCTENFRLVLFSDSLSKWLFNLTEVATKLAYDEFEQVTADDMALEVENAPPLPFLTFMCLFINNCILVSVSSFSLVGFTKIYCPFL